MDIWTEACFLPLEHEQSCAGPRSDEVGVPGSPDTELHEASEQNKGRELWFQKPKVWLILTAWQERVVALPGRCAGT